MAAPLNYALLQGLNMTSNGSNGSNGSAEAKAGVTSKTFKKLTVQKVLAESNGNTLNISNNSSSPGPAGSNTIVRKIKDFGMFGSVNSASALAGAAARKRPLGSVENKPAAPPSAAKKPRPSKDSSATSTPKSTRKAGDGLAKAFALGLAPNATQAAKPAGTPGRKGLPLPQAVARRNARERNRVKQVNNGFAKLRERIPEEVAEAFEAQGNGRGAAKKLSKVETLRMAVEYIRSLERLLGFEFPVGSNALDLMAAVQGGGSSSGEDSFSFIKDEFDALSPGMDEHFDDSMSNYDVDEYFGAASASIASNNTIDSSTAQNNQNDSSLNDALGEGGFYGQVDLLPNITSLNGLQYIRIPGTNTYQLLTPDLFSGNSNSPPNSSIDEEQFSALIDANCLSPAGSPPSAAPAAVTVTVAVALQATPSPPAPMTTAPLSRSRSPVPMSAALTSRVSPQHTASSPTSAALLHQQPQPTTLSPAGNGLLLATRAADRQFVAPTPPHHAHAHAHSQPRLIKQEYVDAEFAASLQRSTTPASASASPTTSTAPTPTTTTTSLIYQAPPGHDQQQQLLLGHATLSMSPPLDRSGSTSTAAAVAVGCLPAFYEHDQSTSFYDGIGVVAFKKEFNDVLLDSSAATAGLSDESMMDAIDWWEAHTPKSDGGSVIL